MGWPQVIWVMLTTAGVTVHMLKHGEPMEHPYHWPSRLVAALLMAGILYWGGFFNGR